VKKARYRFWMLTGLVVLGASQAWAADFTTDPALGYWKALDDKTGLVTSGWEIYLEKDGTLCGKIISMYDYPADAVAARCKKSYKGFPVEGDVSKMTVQGTPWIFGLRNDGPGRWVDGHIVNPEDGTIWSAKVIFHKADGKRYNVDTLEMRGEFALGIGRSQFWPSVTLDEALAVQKPK